MLMQGGILTSMKRYRTDLKTKAAVDELQMKYSCCGNELYTDWFQIAWSSEEFIDVNLPEYRDRMRNGFYISDDVPFSCCDSKSMRPCINQRVHDNVNNFNYIYQKDLTIFKPGCRFVT